MEPHYRPIEPEGVIPPRFKEAVCRVGSRYACSLVFATIFLAFINGVYLGYAYNDRKSGSTRVQAEENVIEFTGSGKIDRFFHKVGTPARATANWCYEERCLD